jgi:hypothetical protein
MNEKQIQAQINMLISQRDNALNMCVNLSGDLAVAKDTIAELEAKVAMLTIVAEGAHAEAPAA